MKQCLSAWEQFDRGDVGVKSSHPSYISAPTQMCLEEHRSFFSTNSNCYTNVLETAEKIDRSLQMPHSFAVNLKLFKPFLPRRVNWQQQLFSARSKGQQKVKTTAAATTTTATAAAAAAAATTTRTAAEVWELYKYRLLFQLEISSANQFMREERWYCYGDCFHNGKGLNLALPGK